MKKLTFIDSKITPVWSESLKKQIELLLMKKFSPFLEQENFLVESGYNAEQIQIRITLSNNENTRVYPVECIYPRVENEPQSVEELSFLMLDYLDVYWNEYLSEGRDTYLPLDWSKHTCEGIDFFIRGFIRNVKLEKEADELLEQEGFGDHDISSISSET